MEPLQTIAPGQADELGTGRKFGKRPAALIAAIAILAVSGTLLGCGKASTPLVQYQHCLRCGVALN